MGHRMQFDLKRRDFITLLGGTAVAWPLAARARSPRQARQSAAWIRENDPEAKSRVQAFRRGLRDLGWIEGRNIVIDYRYAAGDAVRIKRYAKELVDLAPDLLKSEIARQSLRRCARGVLSPTPIVFAVVNDPVGQRFIQTLHAQGLHVTGFTFIDFEMVGRWVLCHEHSPVQTAVRNCTRDEGGPFEVGNQVSISSHRKLLWSKAMVVSVAETSGQEFRQARLGEASASEPSMKCRNAD